MKRRIAPLGLGRRGAVAVVRLGRLLPFAAAIGFSPVAAEEGRHAADVRYRCQVEGTVVRTLSVDLSRIFPLSVQPCEAAPAPVAEVAPASAYPSEFADVAERVSAVTLIEAPLARIVGGRSGREGRVDNVPTAHQFTHLVQQAARRYGLDARFVDAVIHAESRHNANARSPKGALGLMQIMPATGERYGVSDPRALLRPEVNIEVGVRYLSDLWSMLDGRIDLVVAAYNAGEGQVIRRGYQVPPFAETRAYVEKVLSTYERLRGLH